MKLGFIGLSRKSALTLQMQSPSDIFPRDKEESLCD